MRAGRVARPKSVRILHAEMKYAANVLTNALQVPVDGSQKAEGGRQDATMPIILPIPATTDIPIIA